MKKVFFSFFVLAGVICASCNKIENNEVQTVKKVLFTASVETGTTKTTLDVEDAYKIKWEKDDPIYVIDDSGISAECSAIEGGSTSASFACTSLDQPSTPPFYAIYPADGASYITSKFKTVIPSVQHYTEGSFESKAFPMVAVSSNTQLQFKNAASVLAITPTTSVESIKVSKIVVSADQKIAGATEITYDGSGDPAVTATGSSSATLECGEEGVDFGKTFYLAIAPGSYTNFTVTVYDNYGRSFSQSSAGTFSIARSKYARINISVGSMIVDYTLIPESKFSNCYIVPPLENTLCTFKTYKGNSGEAITDADAVAVLWETKNQGGTINEGDIINNVSLTDGVVSFKVKGNKGNAVIAVKKSEKIVWSWHIWVVDNVKADATGILDRAIGAIEAEYNPNNNMLNRALVYQWGRKDPVWNKFQNGECTTNSSNWKFEEATTVSVQDGIENPMTKWHSTTGDWLTNIEKTLWGDEKTMYDPCPVGYKVPSAQELKDLRYHTTNDEHDWIVPVDGGIKYTLVTPNVYWYMGTASINCSKAASASMGYHWTSTFNDNATKATYLRYVSLTTVENSFGSTAFAFPVRCISE